MSSIRLIPNFAWRYPQSPSAEERRAAYIMMTGFHMYLPEGIERESYAAYLQHNPLQPHLGSRTSLAKWADQCVKTCCPNDEDVRRKKRSEAEATRQRNNRQMATIGVLVGIAGIMYGAGRL
jgi:hypothetical protein